MRTPLQRLGRWLSAHPSRARWAALLGGAAATSLLLAACARIEAPWFVLLSVALVPWLAALDRAASLREALGAGAALSAGCVVAVFSWFPGAVERYAGASGALVALLMVVAAPVLEPQFVVYALVRHLARRAPAPRPAVRAAVAGACAYVATELVFPKLFFDTLGHGLFPSLYLRQAADLAGVHGLTFLIVLVNEAVCAALRRPASAPARWTEGRVAPLAAALALVVADLGYGYVRCAQIEARARAPGHVVGLAQANITNYDKLRAEKGAFETVRTILDAHFALSEEIRRDGAPDFIVWPETVYPTTFGAPRSEAGAAFDQEIQAFVASRGVPLVLGAYEAEGAREYNAAVFLSPGPDGGVSWTSYRKRMLFPLTEWVPEALDGPWLRSALPWAGRWTRGPGPRVVSVKPRGAGAPVSIVPLICYDVLFPGFVADAARLGADLIVTLSNDSWFPDARAPRLHLISAAFRSIETRLPQVRATNSGISAAITATGEITATTRWDAREHLIARVPAVARTTTPMVAWGRWLGPALVAATLLLLRGAMPRRPPPPEAPATPPAPKPRDQNRNQKRRRERRNTGMRPK